MTSLRAWRPVPKWLLLGVVIGANSGGVAIAFYGGVVWCTRFLLGSLGGYHPATIAASPGGFHIASGFTRVWAIPLLAAAGALVAALLVFRVAPETEGHGTDVAIRAINSDPAGMRLRTMPVKMIASAITIGSGGSGGTEGPTAQIAAIPASLIAKLAGLDYDEARTAVTAGLAAGVGAIFRAPVGGALLGVELLFRKDREWAMLIPSLIASGVAYVEFSGVYGWTPMFGHVPGMRITAFAQLLIFPLLGLICGGLARLFAVTFYGVGGLFRKWRKWRPLRTGVAGLATGALGLLVPGVLGTGYGTIQDVLSPQRVLHLSLLVLVAMPLAKILGTSLSIGSGGSGGVFGPGMVIGATAGAALWRLSEMAGANAVVPASPALLAVVGMAACLGAAARSPIAITVIAAETCWNGWVLAAALLAVPLAVTLMGSDTLYRAQLLNRKELIRSRTALASEAVTATAHSTAPAATTPQPDGPPKLNAAGKRRAPAAQ
ncbi:MAG: chloride channel protein [Streptosporangiaceae bacterium]